MWKQSVREQFRRWQLAVLASACVMGHLAFATSPIAAQAVTDINRRIRQHLDAGEFAPAIALANGIAAPETRDQMLAAVAQAQVAGGARFAARRTLDEISDDRIRSDAVDQIAAAPLPTGPARGGATMADFDTLIDLVTQTIAPTSWDTVGGPGAITGFPGGVYVDTSGLMQRMQIADGGRRLADLREAAQQSRANEQVLRTSHLRKVSLVRLERELQMRRVLGQPRTEAMKMLAGIYKVRYLFVYPKTGDIVIAGPAGAWAVDQEGRRINAETGQPVLYLDDFVVLLRNAAGQGGRFTCSITPRQANLAATQAYLKKSSATASGASRFAQVRDLMGKQEIEVQGLDPRTRVARVIVEADYRMKLVGIGLEEGVFGVTSYLDSIEIPEGELRAPPAMSVLRWWFTMNYNAVRATPDRQAFEIRGQGVQVLSENEMLTAQGERVHTGKSDVLNEQFAHSFTKHFDALAAKYPIYAELRNVFDLALVAGLIVAEDLPGQTGWHAADYSDPQRYVVTLGAAPTDVETVINQRQVRTSRKIHTIAGVSGGVSVDSSKYVTRSAIETDGYGVLEAEQQGGVPAQLPHDAWWWD